MSPKLEADRGVSTIVILWGPSAFGRFIGDNGEDGYIFIDYMLLKTLSDL
jgi:hypothetical protein